MACKKRGEVRELTKLDFLAAKIVVVFTKRSASLRPLALRIFGLDRPLALRIFGPQTSVIMAMIDPMNSSMRTQFQEATGSEGRGGGNQVRALLLSRTTAHIWAVDP